MMSNDRSPHNRATAASIAYGAAAGAVGLWLTGAWQSLRDLALVPAVPSGQLVVAATRSR